MLLFGDPPLTIRETDVFIFYLLGAQYSEIARELDISINTVKTVISIIRDKHDLHGLTRFQVWVLLMRSDSLFLAINRSLVTDDDLKNKSCLRVSHYQDIVLLPL